MKTKKQLTMLRRIVAQQSKDILELQYRCTQLRNKISTHGGRLNGIDIELKSAADHFADRAVII